jgi:ribosomal protein S11
MSDEENEQAKPAQVATAVAAALQEHGVESVSVVITAPGAVQVHAEGLWTGGSMVNAVLTVTETSEWNGVRSR